jgi:NAD(P)-dependent dehydrogenase (short-subunit alcohol dehydrogenase family)
MSPNSQQPRSLAVITGATGGVGLEIAKGLARAGYGIIVGAPSERRGTEAVTAIRSVATHPASIQQRPLDLASLASVAAFASALPEAPSIGSSSTPASCSPTARRPKTASR